MKPKVKPKVKPKAKPKSEQKKELNVKKKYYIFPFSEYFIG